MARRGVPKQINWHLREWMDMMFPQPRGRQAKMMELTGWPKATMSQLYNNQQDYSPKIVNEAAKALNAEPWELLMPPERAMHIRQVFAQLREIATTKEEDGVLNFSERRFGSGAGDDEKPRKTGTRA